MSTTLLMECKAVGVIVATGGGDKLGAMIIVVRSMVVLSVPVLGMSVGVEVNVSTNGA